jgi:magnesium chelatase family protein
VTRIYSVADQLPAGTPLIRHRPFRAPHHTISHAGLVGGGNIPKPGEISLAHRGVLFLVEFPEFGTRVLEVMRQPMEDKVVTISRAKGSRRCRSSIYQRASRVGTIAIKLSVLLSACFCCLMIAIS